jgi:hypothetical protein
MPYAFQRVAAACRAAATRSRTVEVGSASSVVNAADRIECISTRRSTRSRSGPDSLPR